MVGPRHGVRAILVALLALPPGLARAQPLSDAGAAGAEDANSNPRAEQLRAFLSGELEVDVEPRTLFDIELEDEVAVRVDEVRVASVLRSLADGGTESADGLSATGLDALRSRLELDRARLTFYQLPKERRSELISLHRVRQEAARPKESDVARRLRLAAEEQQRVLEAARVARTEAERLVREEVARLLGLESQLTVSIEQANSAREQLSHRREATLGWQRRASDAHTSSSADAIYDALITRLEIARTELNDTLDGFQSPRVLQSLGPDPLERLPADVSTEEVTRQRSKVALLIVEASRAEAHRLEARAAELHDEIRKLNQIRLLLLTKLSAEKGSATMGLTRAGWAQAVAEAADLRLILRYHAHLARAAISSVHDEPHGDESFAIWPSIWVVLPWIFCGAVFVWWRRKSRGVLVGLELRAKERDRSERRTAPGGLLRLINFAQGIHRPLEWLLFVWVARELMPGHVLELLEVQIAGLVIYWSLGASLVVHVINAVAQGGVHLDRSLDALRLRSLRLVGRVAVGLSLLLVISEELVGRGTIRRWVLTACVVSIAPVFLILVRWWRSIVFDRLARSKGRSKFQSWLLANRTGWRSFPSAMVAAVQLFISGSIRVVRVFLGRLTLVRRIHAYLFRRGLDRLAETEVVEPFRPLRADAFESLSPDALNSESVPSPAIELVETLLQRIDAGTRVFGLVGNRGAGKSTLLGLLAKATDSTLLDGAVPELVSSIRKTAASAARVILIDDAHCLVKPVLGGLASFDEVMDLARSTPRRVWVLAVDSSLWPFIRRARDSRPLFDEVFVVPPWTEDQIAHLLETRTALAGLSPTFEDLLERLPSANELDRQDALLAKRAGYMRMIWDYARGNPGIALEAWRSSLHDSADSVRVRPLRDPDARDIESLPDSALFVLKAILQMPHATEGDLELATRLNKTEISSFIGFGQAHGFLSTKDQHVWVSWRWYRSVLVVLERKHLLVEL